MCPESDGGGAAPPAGECGQQERLAARSTTRVDEAAGGATTGAIARAIAQAPTVLDKTR